MHGLLIAVASLCCRAWALGARASVVVARGLGDVYKRQLLFVAVRMLLIAVASLDEAHGL